MLRPRLRVLALTGALLSGVLAAPGVAATPAAAPAANPAAVPAAAAAAAPCQRPHPCGSHFPRALAGRSFPVRPVERVAVPMSDGVRLAGWLTRPVLPAGVRAPVVVTSSPYDGFLPGPPRDGASTVPTDVLAPLGYAVLHVSVRGTGASGGCFENKGRREQRDQYEVVEWVARQPWSSGRVAMTGLSYPGTTPLEAAIQDPPHLVTVVPMGPVTDVYTEMVSPQGAWYTTAGPNEVGRRAAVTGAPSAFAGAPGDLPAAAVARACPEVARVLTEAVTGELGDTRDAAYFADRRLVERFPRIRAAVWLAHGLHDVAHPFQEDPVWAALTRAPKAALFGQWGHEPPPSDGRVDWSRRLVQWFDYWLKGSGRVPSWLGTVEYQDGTGRWHTSRAWPPREARLEALPLGSEVLGRPGTASFEAVPQVRLSNVPGASATSADGWPGCTLPSGPAGPSRQRLAALSPPLRAPLTLAGNPLVDLRLSADEPGGLVAVGLYAVPPTGCQDARLLSDGAADLRFHDGRMTARPFPSGVQRVRVDLTNLADVVPAGHRVAVVLSGGEVLSRDEAANPLADQRTSRTGGRYAPTVTVHGGRGATASHVLLPVTAGTLGGAAPARAYPPRPFTPR